jgi:CDP-6-deoxy-D-xylo-4-hexulose-3-dehydrase
LEEVVGRMTTEYPCGTLLRRRIGDGEPLLYVVLSIAPHGAEVLPLSLLPSSPQSLAFNLDCLDHESGGTPRELFCDFELRQRISLDETISVRGELSPFDKERMLRQLVQYDAKRYFDEVHKPRLTAPYRSGDRIPYAGRVYDGDDISALLDASLDFWLTTGRFSETFERAFADFLGLRFSCLVNSGSSANLIAFASLTSPLLKERQIKPGDEVITVAAGFPTTVAPIIQLGAVPVFCDITVSDGTYNIDVRQLEEARSERTKAIVLAHTLGNPFNLRAVGQFADRHKLWLVEDNCDALGSTYEGRLTGTFGDLATSSFYPPHHMTMGEGGAVYSKHLKFKRIIESFRDWGRDCWCPAGKDNTCGIRFDQQLGTLPRGYDHKYIYRHFGYNLKATDLQAAIGCAQLKKLPSFILRRRENWRYLRAAVAPLEDLFILPEPTALSEPSWFGFLLTLRPEVTMTGQISRDSIVRTLEECNIQTRMLFAGNLLRQPCFDDLRERKGGYRAVGDLAESDLVLHNSFWFGVYPGLSQGMLEVMVSELFRAVGRRAP